MGGLAGAEGGGGDPGLPGGEAGLAGGAAGGALGGGGAALGGPGGGGGERAPFGGAGAPPALGGPRGGPGGGGARGGGPSSHREKFKQAENNNRQSETLQSHAHILRTSEDQEGLHLPGGGPLGGRGGAISIYSTKDKATLELPLQSTPR